MSRKFRRFFQVVLVLVLYCVATIAYKGQVSEPETNSFDERNLDAVNFQQQFRLSPQEQYQQEIQSTTRQFDTFASTLKRILPQRSRNPHLIDDPRLKSSTTEPTPKIYRPYPDYGSKEWKSSHRGSFKPCMGPRGKEVTDNLDDQVSAYVGTPKGFPTTLFGSHKAVGLDESLSFDRYTRYGAYGYAEDESNVENWAQPSKVNWNGVDWGTLQDQCAAINADRFDAQSQGPNSHIAPEARTAILIRSYTGKTFSDNDIVNLRAMVSELSLQSGGEYKVVLLTHVKDDSVPLDDPTVWQWLLQENIPREFWGITHFWNMPQVVGNYPELSPELMDVHHSQWLPVQQYTLQNPQFEYIWNWEIDTRFTGHYYEFADRVANFGSRQPRRGIWERSERFYIPGYHGDYDGRYRSFVDAQSGLGVWGAMPMRLANGEEIIRQGPAPPVPVASQDPYQWGVGEQADLMVFLPMFNPINTEWVIRNEVFGYLAAETPRRAALITHSRLSRRLILTMDSENRAGRHMSAEMFHVSTAFIHGFKGVSVPHPVYSDRLLPSDRVSRWFNSGVNGRSGSTMDSPFSWGRESRFKDVSWYYRANLPGRLYWNFLGWEKEGTGGPQYEEENGRYCLPSILFHPVKDVQPDADSTHYDFDADNGSIATPDELAHINNP
ncbi:hypothetical protein PENANT_c007G07773 [Penicillium antarcticum]|uniref:Uncharacterized protein n=1 Tax=Penicillium antarcticum TaxID=416450 RepID=A0A1V6QC11_9EURO|nr:uncharacterized protein N7508_003471 [Penicillium antarcticum]KAJ5312641.1 hypothetical protein N7508_003471 [Penicillium antarcticum]OQD86748.1 hypothetical protein PENANT_c007G07773 [Penicillium antarcticum]